MILKIERHFSVGITGFFLLLDLHGQALRFVDIRLGCFICAVGIIVRLCGGQIGFSAAEQCRTQKKDQN